MLPLDPRDRMLGDLVARVRQIERRSGSQGVMAAKVTRVTNVVSPPSSGDRASCSARNTSPAWTWFVPGDTQAMEWTAHRAETGFSIASSGVTVAEGGWHRVTATIYGEASGACFVSGVLTVNGTPTGGRFRLDMDTATYDSGGAFYDAAVRVAELNLSDGDEVGVELRIEDASTGFTTPGSTSVLVVEKI